MAVSVHLKVCINILGLSVLMSYTIVISYCIVDVACTGMHWIVMDLIAFVRVCDRDKGSPPSREGVGDYLRDSAAAHSVRQAAVFSQAH